MKDIQLKKGKELGTSPFLMVFIHPSICGVP
jgi:hypothetical protein